MNRRLANGNVGQVGSQHLAIVAEKIQGWTVHMGPQGSTNWRPGKKVLAARFLDLVGKNAGCQENSETPGEMEYYSSKICPQSEIGYPMLMQVVCH
jgi:hypothetical protein